jgi:hypothetical protein
MMQEPISIPANSPINVTLEAQDWNSLMWLIDEAPVPGRIAGPLKEKIRQQITTAAQQLHGELKQQPSDGNGLDRDMAVLTS